MGKGKGKGEGKGLKVCSSNLDLRFVWSLGFRI